LKSAEKISGFLPKAATPAAAQQRRPANSHVRDAVVAGRICFFATGMNYLLDLW